MASVASWTPLGGGLFLGWALGANDAGNCFGTAVGSRIISFRRASLLCGGAVIVGAVLQGSAGIETLSGITHQTVATAAVVAVAAALTGTLMTVLRIPISTSQAVVGAILGIGLATGESEYKGLIKIVVCWVGTPIGSMIVTCIIYKLVAISFRHIPIGILARDKLLWMGLVSVGIYGSYALGANNVANSTGIFSGLLEGVSDRHLAAIGGIAMASGVVTYSKRVMMSVGSGIMRLDAFTAFVAVLSMSLTVHLFAVLGVPVSTSQGIVGSIIGIGLFRGAQGIQFRAVLNIAYGWILTPAISLVLAAAGYAVFCRA